MKYIILCGGYYLPFKDYPTKHFVEINGESLVERTIRLLNENGVSDYDISLTANRSHVDLFTSFGYPVIIEDPTPYWVDGFPKIGGPVCYIFGDVFFSPEAIKTIIETDTKDIDYFASAIPFYKHYTKGWAEPFAFKVQDFLAFEKAVDTTKKLQDEGKFCRVPAIAWELWQVIKGTEINVIDYNNYIAINDYTRDIDTQAEYEEVLSFMHTYGYMRNV